MRPRRSAIAPTPGAPPFRRLHERYPVQNLAEGTLVGHPEMPEFRFNAGEVSDIIAYLKSIQTDAQAGWTGAEVGRGEMDRR